jgi:hypothetical protein
MDSSESQLNGTVGALAVVAGIGVLTLALFPLALPFLILTAVATVPLVLPLLVPVVLVMVIVGIWKGARALGRGIRGVRPGRADRRAAGVQGAARPVSRGF